MKKLLSLLFATLSLSAIAFTASGCSIIEDVENAVVYPDHYSLTYEITTSDGVIQTAQKTVDENGSVYLKMDGEEKLFINENGVYTLYQKDENNLFVQVGEEKYTKKVVDEQTSAIEKYSEESTKKFMPTAKLDSTSEVLGRACDVYKLGVGTSNNSAFYYYHVDKLTGICLKLEVKHTALGQEVSHNTETFICVEFITENIQNLNNLLTK